MRNILRVVRATSRTLNLQNSPSIYAPGQGSWSTPAQHSKLRVAAVSLLAQFTGWKTCTSSIRTAKFITRRIRTTKFITRTIFHWRRRNHASTAVLSFRYLENPFCRALTGTSPVLSNLFFNRYPQSFKCASNYASGD